MAVLVMVVLCPRLSVVAQETKPAFEVASIKPNRAGPGANSVSGKTPTGYMMRNGWIESLITTAYPHIGRTEILGAPDWIRSERFDINAAAGRQATAAETQAMLRALLVERFQFVAHEETQEQARARAAAGSPRWGPGPELHSSSTLDCEAIAAAKSAGRPAPPLPNGALPCMMSIGTGAVRGAGRPLSELARALSAAAGRTVLDKTGLSGIYDFALRFGDPLQTAGTDRNGDDRPSLFTAVEEQLGLKLEPDRTDVRVLVIERLERPTPN